MSIKKNDEIKLKIEAMTAEGSGIGRYDGMAIFVANTAIGDEVVAHIIKAKSNYAIAKAIEIISPSADRIEPDCSVFTQCGGCVYRHINYEAEKQIKWQKVKDAFQRIGHIEIEPEKIIGADNIMRYRNKAQYPTGFDKELKIGFYATHSHRIVNCRDCVLQPEEFKNILGIFEEWIKENHIELYDEKNHRGYLRHIYLRQGAVTKQIMACAVVNGKRIKELESLCEKLKSVENIKSIVLNINKNDTNVILGEECITLWGEDYIEDELCSLKFRISPLSFYQVNHEQTEKLYKKAKEYARLTGDETLVDLYCGTGTIGLTMADKAKKIIGVEIVEQAIENSKINAKINNIENAEFICADAPTAAKQLLKKGIKPDVVIIDPPRKGCGEDLVKTIEKMEPQRVVYVSCDSATLARDCEFFEQSGYKVKEVTPVDLFPRTSHTEAVALLSRA
ncbi:MAG: 23S rRNA (uracil(1939)-C(5))-methyltransferase RlmD [Clostridiales bacterium]|nr:23S rRNA (uracil(1939)-C(5))-methyltransferase RlmD [Clostridiales bacterium]